MIKKRTKKMSRNQRDEPTEPAIADSTTTDSGSGGSDANYLVAINHLIDAMEDAGIILRT